MGSVQFISLAQLCPTLCDPMNRSTPGLPVHHQLPEFTQTHVHWVCDTIEPSHPLLSLSPPAPNPAQHQGLFQWVNSSHDVAKVLEFQLQHQSFQWTPRTDLLLDGLVGSPSSPRDSQESSPWWVGVSKLYAWRVWTFYTVWCSFSLIFITGYMNTNTHLRGALVLSSLPYYFVLGYSQLTNNVVIISSKQWRDTYTYMYTYIYMYPFSPKLPPIQAAT